MNDQLVNELEQYYKDSENCYLDLGLARKAFGSTCTTQEQYEQMEKGLGIMYLYCPENIQFLVLATMEEASWRKGFHAVRWIENNSLHTQNIRTML